MPRSALNALRALFVLNAAFSATCGVALVRGGDWQMAAFPGIPGWVFFGIGVGLVGFAGLLLLLALHPRPGTGALIGLADILWILATIPLAILSAAVAPDGAVLIFAVAAVVGGFALGQLLAVRAMVRDRDRPGHYRHCVRVPTTADADALWAVIADLGRIADHSDMLARSGMRGGAPVAPGAIRDCADAAGRTWSEQVERLDPVRREVTLRFLADAPGFPFPVREMTGGWRVIPWGEASVTEVWWSLVPTGRFGWLKVALLSLGLDLSMPGVIARMDAAAGGADGRAPLGLALVPC